MLRAPGAPTSPSWEGACSGLDPGVALSLAKRSGEGRHLSQPWAVACRPSARCRRSRRDPPADPASRQAHRASARPEHPSRRATPRSTSPPPPRTPCSPTSARLPPRRRPASPATAPRGAAVPPYRNLPADPPGRRRTSDAAPSRRNGRTRPSARCMCAGAGRPDADSRGRAPPTPPCAPPISPPTSRFRSRSRGLCRSRSSVRPFSRALAALSRQGAPPQLVARQYSRGSAGGGDLRRNSRLAQWRLNSARRLILRRPA